jgi:N-acetylglucosamine kinase-like BadF-type ATPase
MILAIDIGGSGSRAVLVAACEPLVTVEAPPVAVGPGGIEVGPALDAIAGAVAGPLPPPDVVSVGVTGLMALGSGATVAADLRRRWPAAAVVLASDAVTALAGACGTAGGAVVAAGTGTVGFGTDFREIWHRVDGWGHLLGDDGGGAWVGRRGLAAALRAYDGRPGGSGVLLAAARSRFGEPEGWPSLLYPSANPATVLAGFATSVAEAAREGDRIAAQTWADAGAALAETAAAALVPGLPPRLAVVGGVTRAADLVQAPFERALERLRPGVTASFGASSPLDGAVTLARMPRDGSGLTAHPPYCYLAERGRT